jgi:formate-dependent nitrite reductase cytochrome c552 subunit
LPQQSGAECKSPLLWDPAATHEDNDPIAVEDWQDVTCGGCHPPHHLRVEWGTPIGIVVDPTAAEDHDIWMPLYDTNELCEYCHSGSRHARDFQGWGKVMYEKKDVTCVDCHMADTPNSSPDGFGEYHEFTVADNLPYSCGIGDGACHANKTSDWAAKQMAKAKIHGKN